MAFRRSFFVLVAALAAAAVAAEPQGKHHVHHHHRRHHKVLGKDDTLELTSGSGSLPEDVPAVEGDVPDESLGSWEGSWAVDEDVFIAEGSGSAWSVDADVGSDSYYDEDEVGWEDEDWEEDEDDEFDDEDEFDEEEESSSTYDDLDIEEPAKKHHHHRHHHKKGWLGSAWDDFKDTVEETYEDVKDYVNGSESASGSVEIEEEEDEDEEERHHHKKGWLGSAWDDFKDTVEETYEDVKDYVNGSESESASGSVEYDDEEEYDDEDEEERRHHKKGWLGSAWDDFKDTVEETYEDVKDYVNGSESESASGSVEYDDEEEYDDEDEEERKKKGWLGSAWDDFKDTVEETYEDVKDYVNGTDSESASGSVEYDDDEEEEERKKKGWLGSAWDDFKDTVEETYEDVKDYVNGTDSESGSSSDSIDVEDAKKSEESVNAVGLAANDNNGSVNMESYVLIGSAVGAAVGIVGVILAFAVRAVRHKAATNGSVLTDDEAAVAMAGEDEEAEEGDESGDDVEAGVVLKDAKGEEGEEEGKFEGSV